MKLSVWPMMFHLSWNVFVVETNPITVSIQYLKDLLDSNTISSKANFTSGMSNYLVENSVSKIIYCDCCLYWN